MRREREQEGKAGRDSETTKRRPAATWALLVIAGTVAYLVAAGILHGEWRGVIVTLVQVAVVGSVTYRALR